VLQGPSSAEVSAALERILSRPEFAERSVPAVLRLLGELWQAFTRWLVSLIPQIVPERWHPLFSAVLAALAALAAVWLLVRIVERLGPHAAVRLPDRQCADEAVTSTDAAWWEQAARSAAAAGRFRDGAQALYMAAVLRLDERGVFRFQSGKTPGDYRREARSSPEVRGAFDGFVRLFLPVAFGPGAPDAAAFAALRVRATELGVHG
jgi:hypothetical protein